MKLALVLRWVLLSFPVLAVVAVGLWFSGWHAPWGNRSVVLAEQFGKVENGSAYDRAAIDLGATRRLVLPDDAEVRRTDESGAVRLFMKKTLSFVGHPPEGMSIRDARKNMGCAVKAEGNALVVATYGEWDSHIEGGGRIKLLAVVPSGVDIEQRTGLSGEHSAGREWHGDYLTKPKDAKGGYWYGPASPANDWTAVPDVPDPARAAG